MRPDFPAVIDNSMLSAFKSCPRKARLDFFEHWKPKGQSVHLHAGAAFASGLEAARRAFFEKGHPADDAVAYGLKALVEHYGNFEAPEGSVKTLERMMGALEFYFTNWPLGVDSFVPANLGGSKLGIEFNFTLPLEGLTNPQTGDPLLYTGRMDMLSTHDGMLFVQDEKTTSQLGASWGSKWDLRGQFTGYAWGARHYGFDVQGVLVRGVSILKTKYDCAEAISYRPQWQIDRWLESTHYTIQRMIIAWQSGWWDYNLDESCADFGGCQFRRPCMTQDPQPWLEIDFERRRWDPVTRTETLL